MTHHQACCCGPEGPDCTACRTGGNCVSRFGYTSVDFSSTLEFVYGFEPTCALCTTPFRVYDGFATFNGPTDFGTLNLPVGLTTPPNCQLVRSVFLTGPNSYGTSPVIGTAVDQCSFGFPNRDLQPIHSVGVFCQVIRGVAYGICVVTVQHLGGGGALFFTRISYRRPMGTDCYIPLGTYTHYETVYDPSDTGLCSQPQCSAGCQFDMPQIWDISPGTVTIA